MEKKSSSMASHRDVECRDKDHTNMPSHTSIPESYERWSLIQRLRDTFWAHWSSEYLNELQRRTKWTDVKENLKVGQLVLLKNASQIPMKWTLARVIKIHPGEDGLVRVVDVKTAKGTFTIAVTNLLQMSGDVGLSPNEGRDVIATKTN
ncbi:integrase catalytic domain-containing protein [Trichonephila inaurata madagascariensis]|uniref:Integrase catalytic domain-containing protein n=1 Tax=Trichonephila inaurata madagascariensis TaxID=2747483 RepID=A0A8X7CQT8_9ARAC|nr:integrase catalytic domain-containing protein [Trichonephila inaurata madagascariensis]